MMVPPIPWRCSVAMPAFSKERFAISARTYDSVNFFEPTRTGSAETEAEKRIRKTGKQEEKSKAFPNNPSVATPLGRRNPRESGKRFERRQSAVATAVFFALISARALSAH